MTVRQGDVTVDWIGYATARVAVGAGPVVYVDPGRYGVLEGYDARDGDVVLVTHDHHYDPDGIRRVARPDATVVVFEAVDAARIDRDVEAVAGLPHDVVRIGPRTTCEVRGVTVRTTPARNLGDAEAVSHPPGFGCGYVLAVGDRRIFWPGDTDLLESFAELDADVYLANIGGSVVMDRRDAAELASWLAPDLTVPIHYDTIPILEADAAAFAADVAGRGLPVAIDDPAP
ncbi:MAG: MBL fold metallo-hydrolase [Halobacteriales archaeon]